MTEDNYAVRTSDCGNGNDDRGKVVGVFSTREKAENFVAANKDKLSGDIDIEGPFILDNPGPTHEN